MEIHSLTATRPIGTNVILTPITVSNIPFSKKIGSQGLWDTGATHSAITKSLAAELGLQPVGVRSVSGVHGVQLVNQYYITITLQNDNVIFDLRVTECASLSANNDVGMLIGMDIIGQGDFAVTNCNGKMMMSFRTPSVQNIDFVEASKVNTPIVSAKLPSRNSPCICGSKKKVKHCCGK